MKEKNFLKTRLNCAIVFNGDIERIQDIKEALANHGVKLIYQKISAQRLIIKEEGVDTYD